jgi:uncharacterized membrane protein YfcA
MIRLRIAFALAGFTAAVLSVALDERLLAWLAIALLAISLILRVILRKREARAREDDRPV